MRFFIAFLYVSPPLPGLNLLLNLSTAQKGKLPHKLPGNGVTRPPSGARPRLLTPKLRDIKWTQSYRRWAKNRLPNNSIKLNIQCDFISFTALCIYKATSNNFFFSLSLDGNTIPCRIYLFFFILNPTTQKKKKVGRKSKNGVQFNVLFFFYVTSERRNILITFAYYELFLFFVCFLYFSWTRNC